MIGMLYVQPACA